MNSFNFDEIIDRAGTASVKYDLRKLFFHKEDVIPMWVADMDFRTPSFIVEAVRDRAEHEIFGYSIRPEEYYTSIIGWMQRRHNWDIKKDWICFSPGVVPALSLLVLAYTQPGDKIIVQPPVYFPFFSTIENNGRRLVNNPLVLRGDRYVMDLEGLKKQLDGRCRMLFLCNPHNPTGNAWTPQELGELADICLENDILIVSDEIHADLALPGFRHTPVATLSAAAAAQTITCIAPSKTFNLAGMATSSLIISNEKIRKQYLQVLDTMHLSLGNLFGTVASIAAYTHGDHWLDAMLAYVNNNISLLGEFLEQKIPKIRMIRPEATYMAWLDCREMGLDQKALNDFFIQKAGLGLNDGAMFGQGGEGFMRINVACPASLLLQALAQLEKAVHQLP